MTVAGSRPWLLSLAVHALAVAVVAALLLASPPAPSAVRLHLVPASAGKADPRKPSGTPGSGAPSRSAPARAAEPAVPGWRGSAPAQTAEPTAVPAPVSLDELLGSLAAPPAAEAQTAVAAAGWSSAGGEGYAPPPLPPPGLAPPQGARWSLVLSIPGGGGFATHVEGLDSGHPELDNWLEVYLRTVSFPPSLEGGDYQLKWVLRLETGRPR